uniref:T-cell receptor beta chain ANA 11, putative n=1 Tax=Brugia malayi TaxID=6279 RepID=A8P4C4_BRUMA
MIKNVVTARLYKQREAIILQNQTQLFTANSSTHTHTYTHTYIRTYTYSHTHIYIHTHTHTRTYIYTSMTLQLFCQWNREHFQIPEENV